MRFSLVTIFLIATLVNVALAGSCPWQRRIGRNVDVRHKLSYGSIAPVSWPAEPESPSEVDAIRFKAALSALCGRMPPSRLDQYTNSILNEARKFGVDPFLIGALVYDGSNCRPRTPDHVTKWGVTRIDLEMHAPHIRNREYTYYLYKQGEWKKYTIKMESYPFNKWKLEKIPSNIYFAAAILKVLSLQCNDLDRELGGKSHRHFVSHWFFGDRVRAREPEDRVLTLRRRLLAYYHHAVPAAVGVFKGHPIVSPVDGVPRLVIDYFGNKRDDKRGHGHQGIDISGVTGEPVRSVAAGKVTFAGVDLPGTARSRAISLEDATRFDGNNMGPGGLWVAINHSDGFRSLYMHLDSLKVQSGDIVTAGQEIGTLGRSGTVASGPHLHLEFRIGTTPVDPAVPLAEVLVNPFLTSALEKKPR